jgi:hypothetical protein
MCGFRQTRSDRKPQWDQGWGGVGDVRISPEAFGPQAAVGQSKGGKGMCGFRQRRSDRRPQWNHGERGEGDVRISPEAFGPQAAVGPGGS